ncbi:MAG TPA: DUF6340 family protein [Prolixibacteraceae bacterium]|nr:DUF6340 family protein [Prolixibacteraceae bacterium]
MNSNLKLFFLLPAVWAFSACTVYRQVPIEVLRTEEVKLPLKENAIAFVSRNFKFNKDTLQNYYMQDRAILKELRTGRRETDSLVVMSCLHAVAAMLKEKGVCDQPVFYPYDIFPPQTGERIIPLPTELVKKMAKPAKADYLLALETITYFFSIDNGMAAHEGFQQVALAGVWNLYNGETGKVVDHKTLTDTLYWNLEDRTDKTVVTPPRLVALQQAAAVMGENYAKRYYSDWEKVERMLIIPPLEDFRQAAALAEQQEWDKAAEIWRKYIAQKYGKLAISACYNLALSAEISDDLPGAATWIDKAVKLASPFKGSDELEYALNYLKIISTRIAGIENISGTSKPE